MATQQLTDATGPHVQAPYTVTVSGQYKSVLNATSAEVTSNMTEGTAEFSVTSSEMDLSAASGNSANLSFTVNASSLVSCSTLLDQYGLAATALQHDKHTHVSSRVAFATAASLFMSSSSAPICTSRKVLSVFGSRPAMCLLCRRRPQSVSISGDCLQRPAHLTLENILTGLTT